MVAYSNSEQHKLCLAEGIPAASTCEALMQQLWKMFDMQILTKKHSEIHYLK